MGQITPDQLQALLAYASKQLGMTPEQLAGTVKEGGLGALTVNDLVGDRQKTEEFLSSPEVKKALGKLLGGR